MNAKEQSTVQSQGSSSSTAVVDGSASTGPPSRYESQKRRDWNTFGQYLKNHRPPLALSKCSGAHVLEFLRYLDQFGKTKVHVPACPFFGHPQPPAPCGCPLKQAWGSLDALIGRLRAAYEENGGRPESNPFGARAVRLYLREVRDLQSKARGIAYEKKKRKRPQVQNVQAQQQLQAPPHQSQSQTQTQIVQQQPPPSYPNFMNPHHHHHHHLQALANLPPPHQSLSAAIAPGGVGGSGGGGGGSVLNNVGVGPNSQHHPFLSSASMMMHLHHNS